jgi:8-amino-7-oxononanoate synthase
MQSLVRGLEKIREQGLFRQLTLPKKLLDFSSNDYLGLSRRPEIRSALLEALESGTSLGSTGSRLLCGNLKLHQEIEEFLAESFRAEAALLFSSGYLANLGVLSALGTEETEFFSDELNHASLIDGMRLSKAAKTIFSHNDPNDLRVKLLRSASARKAIVSESVFSMDGDLAQLGELVELAREFDAWLVMDEAHATGVFGSNGYGLLENFHTADLKLIAIHTCGKSLGAQGAFVLCSRGVRDYLINFCRPFIFSTAISPLIGLQIKAAVELLPGLAEERKRLYNLASAFRAEINPWFDLGKSESQIVPIILGSNEKVLRASARLQEQGLDVRAIRSPTVPRGTERLRVSLKSFHSANDLRRLKDGLRGVSIL